MAANMLLPVLAQTTCTAYTVGMKKREFVWAESDSFIGWRCSACGWLRLIPRLEASAEAEKPDAKMAFDKHKCEDHPLKRKPSEDVNQAVPPPHLIADGNVKRCSVCGYPFQPDAKPCMSVAFADHLLKAHKPSQMSQDVNQAAARETA